MIENVLRPIAEGFRGCLALCKGIMLHPLSIFSLFVAFVKAPRLSDFNPSRRSN